MICCLLLLPVPCCQAKGEAGSALPLQQECSGLAAELDSRDTTPGCPLAGLPFLDGQPRIPCLQAVIILEKSPLPPTFSLLGNLSAAQIHDFELFRDSSSRAPGSDLFSRCAAPLLHMGLCNPIPPASPLL